MQLSTSEHVYSEWAAGSGTQVFPQQEALDVQRSDTTFSQQFQKKLGFDFFFFFTEHRIELKVEEITNSQLYALQRHASS